MIAHPLTLEGQFVRLEPLEREHIEPLMVIARATPDVFKYTSTPVTEAQRDAYFARAFELRERGEAYPFVMIEPTSDLVIGTTRYADINWQHRNCELGYTWIDPAYQGSAVNAMSKYLMLRYAFEELGLLRVHFHTDTRNVRSQEAIKQLGAVYEGTMRRHMVSKDGYVRDTMLYAIVDVDWPELKRGLEARLRTKLGSR